MLSRKLLDELLWQHDLKENYENNFHTNVMHKVNSTMSKGFNSYAKTNIIGEKPVEMIL